MPLPLKTDYAPMDALAVADVPHGNGWQYEPKWDGFRCLVFRDGAKVELQSKKGQPLARYFPELVEALARVKARKFVLDGEIVVPVGKALSFDELLQRIHPAASRIRKLSVERPATLVVFDLLVDERGKPLAGLALVDRRARLESFAKKYLKGRREDRALAGDAQRARCAQVARGRRRDARRGDRQAARPALPVRHPPGHGEGEAHALGRLRRRRVSLRDGQPAGRLAAARAVQRARPARPRRLLLDHPRTGQTRADEEAREAHQTPRLHRPAPPAGPAAGARSAARSGSRSIRSSSSRCNTTTSPTAGSVTGRSCCAGGRTSRRASAR